MNAASKSPTEDKMASGDLLAFGGFFSGSDKSRAIEGGKKDIIIEMNYILSSNSQNMSISAITVLQSILQEHNYAVDQLQKKKK